MEILIPLFVITTIGLIVGLGLSFADKFFSVPSDEEESKIRECLPGANCGACGYSGCEAYAAAIASKEASPNLCAPGGDATAKALSELLGVEVKTEKAAAFLACGGNCEITAKDFAYSGMASCAAANLVHAGPISCKYGCIGFGDCAKVCDYGAITVNNGKVTICEELCVSCGKCVNACPKALIKLLPADKRIRIKCSNRQKGAAVAKQCKASCVACMQCENVCPVGAIKVIDNIAVIDYSLCTQCGKCKAVCKRGVIV